MSSLHKLKAMLRMVAVVIVMGSLVGCGGRLGDFTMLSSKQFNVPVNSMEKGARVTGEDCSNHFLFFRFGHIHPSVKTAIDQAIEKESANALVDAVVEWNEVEFIIFGSVCYTVTGTAVKLK